MKHTHTSLVALFVGVMVTAGFSQAPAIQDGSNKSRAPIPAKRQFDDIKSPDGQAIDAVATDIVAMPPPRVVILQGATAPVYTATTTTTYTEPALTPTGRPTVVVPAESTPVIIATPSAPVEIRSTQSTPMTRPAVQDGSNWSRAPLPAKRQFDDVKAPDGQAIDQLPEVPPNSGR